MFFQTPLLQPDKYNIFIYYRLTVVLLLKKWLTPHGRCISRSFSCYSCHYFEGFAYLLLYSIFHSDCVIFKRLFSHVANQLFDWWTKILRSRGNINYFFTLRRAINFQRYLFFFKKQESTLRYTTCIVIFLFWPKVYRVNFLWSGVLLILSSLASQCIA